MKSVLTEEEIQKKFMEIFKFDVEDLSANRKEMMSAKQK